MNLSKSFCYHDDDNKRVYGVDHIIIILSKPCRNLWNLFVLLLNKHINYYIIELQIIYQ